MQLSAAAAALNAPLQGTDRSFTGVSTDTRTLRPGALFFALRGARHDAHHMLGDALHAGAAGVVVDQPVAVAATRIAVGDTRQALGDLAHVWRERFELPLVAITGSNGKTTVKEMLAAILRRAGPVLATRGNLNNDIGVPQTLYELGAEHRYAVIEMGANHPGEIKRLVQIACPRIAAITLCAPAHLQGFGSIEGVAQAKAEIFHALDSAGTAVINGDDPFADFWRSAAGAARVLTFGIGAGHDFRAADCAADAQRHGSGFRLHTPDGAIDVALPLPGTHNIRNALAAAACAWALDVELSAIAAGLAAAPAIPGRMQFKPGIRGTTIIDDTYNANPASVMAAIDVLRQCTGRRWLVLGDMGELGAQAAALHRRCGAYARDKGVEQLLTIGELARHAAAQFGNGAEHCTTPEQIIEHLRADLGDGDTVLVKASRTMQLEKVVAGIAADGDTRC